MIERNLGVMLGKPVIRGTKITVELILGKLSPGGSIEDVLRAHSRLSREAILAAVEFRQGDIGGAVTGDPAWTFFLGAFQ